MVAVLTSPTVRELVWPCLLFSGGCCLACHSLQQGCRISCLLRRHFIGRVHWYLAAVMLSCLCSKIPLFQRLGWHQSNFCQATAQLRQFLGQCLLFQLTSVRYCRH